MVKKATFLQKTINSISNGISNTFFDKQKKAIALQASSVNRNFGLGMLGNVKKVGLPKPTKVTFEQLRLIADSDTIIRICINAIKKAVSQADWNIIPTKRYVNTYDPEHIERINTLFELVNSQGENLRTLLAMVLEDLLVCDAGVVEKVYNAEGDLVELNSVDAATLRPKLNKYGELGGYVQVINSKVVATFKPNEIIYIMQNPQNNVKLFGFGKSAIEEILLTVQASLNADIYNAKIFSNDNIPPGFLDLGNMSEAEAQNLIAVWNATVIGNSQKLKFLWGSDNVKKFTSFNSTNKDMQYMKYVDWLSRLKLANYGLSAMDANITQDVNKSTAEVSQSITSSRGVNNIFALLEDYINREIVLPMGFNDVQFKFTRDINLKEKKQQAEIDKIYIETGVVLPSDIAKREGMDTYIGMDEEDEYDGGRSPNPEDNEIKPKPDKKDVLEEKSVKRKSTRYYKPLYK